MSRCSSTQGHKGGDSLSTRGNKQSSTLGNGLRQSVNPGAEGGCIQAGAIASARLITHQCDDLFEKCLLGYNKWIQQGRSGIASEGTSTPPLNLAEMELAETFLAEIGDNYDWKADMQIQSIILPTTNGACALIADTMQKITRLADTRLLASQQFASQLRRNEEQIGEYKEEVRRMSALIKESLESLAGAMEVQKVRER
ncbi:hypothetical protein R1flu_009434 [Riccia fluitans]|uniref:Uncharacterized protein n=1 Tax=Riccia fluitans TaxID=41844 RepID=A0ABD1Z232_9MARC